MKTSKRALVLVVNLLVIAFVGWTERLMAQAAPSSLPPGILVDIGSHKLHIHCVVLVDPTHESSVLGSVRYGGWVRLREKAASGRVVPEPRREGFRYSGSDEIDRVAWYDRKSGDHTHEVAQKAPNQLGIYDMSGNVWEWCQDSFTREIQRIPADGSAFFGESIERVHLYENFTGQCRCPNRGRPELSNAWQAKAWTPNHPHFPFMEASRAMLRLSETFAITDATLLKWTPPNPQTNKLDKPAHDAVLS